MPPSLTDADLARAATSLGVPVENIKVVVQIEGQGGGFLPDGRLKILFEPVKFHEYTEGRFDASHPHLSIPAWSPTYRYGTLAQQWDKFTEAFHLDQDAAAKSCSWGLFQILGSNYREAGFLTPFAMLRAYETGEVAQLASFCALLAAWGLVDELAAGRDTAASWEPFARRYNGPGYARHAYHARCAAAYRAIVGGAKPKPETMPVLHLGHRSDDVAYLQRLLGITEDRWFGPQTEAAVMARQLEAELVPDGIVGKRTWAALLA